MVKHVIFMIQKKCGILWPLAPYSGLEIKLAYSQNASENERMRVTFVKARKMLRVAFSGKLKYLVNMT